MGLIGGCAAAGLSGAQHPCFELPLPPGCCHGRRYLFASFINKAGQAYLGLQTLSFAPSSSFKPLALMTRAAKSRGKIGSPPPDRTGGSKNVDKAAGSKPNNTLALVPANESKSNPTPGRVGEPRSAPSGGAGGASKGKR